MVAVETKPSPSIISPAHVYASKGTPENILALKQHIMSCAARIAEIKGQMKDSQAALAALPQADVQKVVLLGYPPPAV